MEMITCEECGIDYYSETIVPRESFRHVFPDIVKLETELAEARAEVEGLKRENIELLVKYDEKFDVIDRKDKLIEQMRDALRKATNFVGLARARDELSSSHWVYDECIAALSAAERVE